MTDPQGLRYTEDHEWVGAGSAEEVLRIGITHYAQDQLGDVVFVELPEVGRKVSAGEVFGEIESTKSVSELLAPASGEVTAVNEDVVTAPELINSDPYGQGWLIEIKSGPVEESSNLLDAAAYQALIQS